MNQFLILPMSSAANAGDYGIGTYHTSYYLLILIWSIIIEAAVITTYDDIMIAV